MATAVTIDLRHVARGLSIPLRQLQAVVELLDEGNTVPFITRYRKDQTGGLDEEQIRQVQARLAKMRLLADRKETILRSIEAQGKLTERLAKQIHSASTTKRLEDLYLPFKPKKQTLATLARSRGLEPLARETLEADPACVDLDARAADFVDPDRQIPTPADALLGAGHILAEQFSEQAELRQRLREILQRTGRFVSTGVDAEAKTQTEKPVEAVQTPDNSAVKPPEATEPPEDPNEKPAEAPEAPGNPGEEPPEATNPPEAPDNPGEEPPEATNPPEAPGNPGEEPAEATQPREAPDNPGEKPPEATNPPEAPDNPGEKPPEATNPPEAPGNPGEKPPEATNPPEAPGNPGEKPPEAAEAPGRAAEQPGEASETADDTGEKPAEASSDPLVEAAAEKPSGPAGPPQAGQPAAPSGRPALPSRKTPPKRAKSRQRLGRRELKKKRAEEKKIKAFRDYFDYREEIKKIPPHRVLAINRGERAKVLRVKIESDLEAMHKVLEEQLVPPEHPHADYLRGCARDALSRLILPSLEREIRRELTDRAETHAVEVFARNLRNLLLQPPVRDRRVLAVDPGYKSGCKLAAMDQFGNVLDHGMIYLVGRPERRRQAQQKAVDLIRRFELSAVVIGNGTACRETEDFFAELLAGELKDQSVAYVIVNEAGASVYSTSHIGREEFPDYDASLRGAISIGRRLQDPLSELVKIDAANIGVGLYQHDVKAKHLRTSLDEVVESCVNYVGVDVNTASPALLRYVSGLNQLTARRVYEHRRQHGPFRGREQLRDVPGFGEATFVQAAGFLKISSGDNPLDATWIHPESYEVTSRVLANLQCAAADLTDKQNAAALAERVAEVNLEKMAEELEVGTLTLKDILAQLARPGRDPREDLPAPVFKQGVLKLEDLTAGMELTGTVLNVVDFGAFVDIGMHDSGLVHVSQLADKYVRDSHEVVAVGDIVKVWVLEVDKERRRVSLTMVQPGTQRPRHPRRGEQPHEDKREGRADGRPEPGGGPGGGPGERQSTPRESRRPKSKRPPKGKGPPRGKGPPKPRYRPKPPPKPVVPLTDAMKTGQAPLRTFGDLAQFYDHQQPPDDDQKDREEKKTARDETEAAKTQSQTADNEAESAKVEKLPAQDETQTAETEAQTADSELQDSELPSTGPQAPAAEDEVQPPQEEPPSTPEQDGRDV